MSGKVSIKENCDGASRKSKLPMPISSKLPMPVSTKKGMKRPNSESDDQIENKSPMKARRQPLVEKNSQRKIVTVSKLNGKGLRNTVSSSSMNANARQSQRLQNKKARRGAEHSKLGIARKLENVSTPSVLDQKGIEFEADESALQSILDNTGIEQPTSTAAAASTAKQFPPRHTLAGMTTGTSGKGMFGKPQEPYKKPDFHKWCEEYIQRVSMYQPAAKRRCEGDKGNKTDTGYKFDGSRQSDVNFCGKYNVPNNPTFSSKREQDSKKIGQRTSSQTTLSSFRTPGRLSLAAQTPQRVKSKEVKQGTGGDVWSSARASMGPPAKLPAKVDSNSTEISKEEIKAPRLSLFGRPSLSSKTPGRVSRPPSDAISSVIPSDTTVFQGPGRVLKTVTEDLGFSGMQTSRLSLAAQTPSRVPITEADKDSFRMDARFSLSAQVHGKPFGGIFENEGSMIAPRLSLAAQTPGRVQKPASGSTSSLSGLQAQTPGRVSLSMASAKGPGFDLRMNLDGVLKDSTSQTPGRVPKKGTEAFVKGESGNHTPLRANSVFDSPMHTPGRVPKAKPSTSDLVNKTPLRVLRSITESADRYGTPTRVIKTTQPAVHTPIRVLNTPDTVVKQTPQRVAATQDNDNKHTPQRVLIKQETSGNYTPRRVHNSQHNTWNQTQIKKAIDAPETIKEEGNGTPVTPKQNRHENLAESRTPVTPLQKLRLDNSTTPNEKDQGVNCEPSNVSAKKLTPILKKGTSKSLFDGNQNGKGSPALTTDLRSMWKTKKSANKTPVKREILTTVKKRTLTWADNLESCKSVGHKRSENQPERKLLFCEHEENIDTISKTLLFHAEEPVSYDDAIGSRSIEQQGDESVNTAVIDNEATANRVQPILISHDEMQESPSQENRNTSPPHQTSTSPPHPIHETPAIPDSMQLPVMVAGNPVLSSGERLAVDNDAWNQQVEGKSASPDDLTTVAMSTLQSTRQSPQQTGQNEGEGWKIAASKKLEQIEEYLQNRLKSTNQTHALANNNRTDLKNQTLVVSPSISNNNNVDTVWSSSYYGDSGVVWNQSEVRRCSESEKVDNHSQGSYSSAPRGLDVNSNITFNTTAVQLTQETKGAKVSSFNPNPFQNVPQTSSQDSQTNLFKSHISPTTPTNKRQLDCDENLTPFILRNYEDSVVDAQENYMEESQEPVEEMVIGSEVENQSELSLQTGTLYFPTPLAAVKGEFVTQSETGTKGIDLPIWTPLALRSVARQQNRGDENALNFSLGSCVDYKANNSDSNDERLVLSEISDNQNNREEKHNSSKSLSPASKALHERKTAFRSLSQHGRLKPSAGPLSLRGNLNTSLKHKRQCRQSTHLQTLLQFEHKRFYEAVLDDEVELYMCRLAKRRMVGHMRECCNPVARILTEGDDMSFVPVREEEIPEKASGLESAFEKCMRTT